MTSIIRATTRNEQSALSEEHGAKLRRLRQEAGLSQTQVAQKLEVTKQSVSRWENGLNEPGALHKRTLAILYGVPIEDVSKRHDFISDDLPPESYRRADLDPTRLRDARRRSGLTLTQAAAKVGVSYAAIGQYERGVVTPKADTILKLAAVYQQPLGWFIKRTESQDAGDDEAILEGNLT